MSKYIYTTIYEQFTGLKPPEPKDHKSRRRRGFGHPYRMRLNMQEDATHTHNNSKLRSERDYADKDVYERAPVSVFQPTVKKQPVRKFTAGGQNYHGSNVGSTNNPMSYKPVMPEDHYRYNNSGAEPKITYKKRRQYGPSSFGSSAMSRDDNDNSDY